RREVARRHPDTVSVRYLAAPVTVLGISAGLVLGAVGAATGRPAWVILGSIPVAVYAGGNVLASIVTGVRIRDVAVAVRLPSVFATMHGAWGLGFLRGGVGRK
ncbi:MAG: glycosyltransferase family 2 protein, partial [Candidatus Nanopelagicales bacterium]